jgi:hypothetical protein
MLKYFEVGKEKIYVFILTLNNTSLWRKANVLENIKYNPKINICYGIDGNNKHLTQSLLKKYNIHFDIMNLKSRNKIILETYGRLGRWLSTIMLMKYSMDTGRKIIVFEDDLLLPRNFNFQFSKYMNHGKIVRLGEWGDAYFLDPNACRYFLVNHVYERGIITNDDNEIIFYYKAPFFPLIQRQDFGIATILRKNEKSSIESRVKMDNFTNVARGKKKILVSNRIWEHDSNKEINSEFTNYRVIS